MRLGVRLDELEGVQRAFARLGLLRHRRRRRRGCGDAGIGGSGKRYGVCAALAMPSRARWIALAIEPGDSVLETISEMPSTSRKS